MDVASIWTQIKDRISNELAWTVISDVPTAACLNDGHACSRELRARGNDIRRPAACSDAKRDDGGMFEQEQGVADSASASILDERLLHRKRRVVLDASETPYIHDSSKFCSLSLST